VFSKTAAAVTYFFNFFVYFLYECKKRFTALVSVLTRGTINLSPGLETLFLRGELFEVKHALPNLTNWLVHFGQFGYFSSS
jgi:hypothetical protein